MTIRSFPGKVLESTIEDGVVLVNIMVDLGFDIVMSKMVKITVEGDPDEVKRYVDKTVGQLSDVCMVVEGKKISLWVESDSEKFELGEKVEKAFS